ncbi:MULTISPECIES: type II secretion system F family protein [unclassified Nocardioides]|uniref:type II secretion system F family protein n=1 Tax=unclassified Nocardioides TaxID=2615069 RepID=UPI00361A26A6
MTGGRLLRLAAAGAVLASALVLAPSAHAAGEVDIDHVEMAEDGTVSVLVGVDHLPGNTAAPDLADLEVTLDGEPVEAVAERVRSGEIERTTVLTLDTSESMAGAPIKDAKAAALAFLDSAPADVRVGLVTFSGTVQEVIAPSTDHAALADVIDGIQLTRGTRVYDAVVQSVALAGDTGARSVLVLTDGKDQGGGSSLDDAVAAAEKGDVVIDAVALDQNAEDRALLDQIANASGGDVIEAADPAALEAVFKAQADALASQVLVRFPQPERASAEANLAVSLTTDDATYEDSAYVSLATVTDGGPSVVDVGTPLVSRTMMLVGAAALGVGLAGVLALVLVRYRGESHSRQVISAYLGEPQPGSDGTPAQSSLKDSAVGLTSNLIRGDLETRLAHRLVAAGLGLTAAEWVLLHAGIAFAAGLIGLVLGGAVPMVVLLVAGVVVPWVYLKIKHGRRLRAFCAQLPETLSLIAGGLSAGLSTPQAVDTVVREGNEPMAGELRRALVEQRLGVDIEDALDGVAERMGSEDFGWVVMAIRIQREVGGNLAEILHTVSDTLREREFLRRQVKTLSAEGRLSAWILGALPVGMFLYMLVANREFIRPLYTEALGWAFLGVAMCLLAVGSWFMSKLVKVEV